MKLLIASSLLISAISATKFDATSAVITSQDVWNGLGAVSNLVTGSQYRVYAVYASTGVNDAYAQNVVIKGAAGAQFTVAQLSTPKANSAYILDDTKILTAPIMIADNNPAPTVGFATRVPFTIYIVSTNFPAYPVVSSKHTQGQVSCSSPTAKTCTILSAEKNFQLEKIDTGSATSIVIYNAGYDATTAQYTVMSVNPQTVGSSVLVSGPIATLWSGSTAPYTFNFVLTKAAAYSGSLQPGASKTFLSNGWLRVDESYVVYYHDDDIRYRSVDFGRETLVSFNTVVGNFYAADTLQISCKRGNDQIATYDGHNIAGQVINEWCKTLSMTVTTTRPADPPRFMVQIVSGAFSTSLFTMMIVSLLGGLLR